MISGRRSHDERDAASPMSFRYEPDSAREYLRLVPASSRLRVHRAFGKEGIRQFMFVLHPQRFFARVLTAADDALRSANMNWRMPSFPNFASMNSKTA